MPKLRTLEHETWSDPDLGALTRDARMLAIAMITHMADDEGRLKADPRLLKKEVFGYDEELTVADVEMLVLEIAEKLGNFLLYEVDGRRYMWLRNFASKQGIRYVVASTLPQPDDDTILKFDRIVSDIKGFENVPNSPELFRSRVARAVGLSRVEQSSEKTRRPKSEPSDTQSRFPDDSYEVRAAKYLLRKIRANHPKAKEPNIQAWAREFDRIFRIDKRERDEVKAVIDLAAAHTFWWKNILSPTKLRLHYDRLLAESASTPSSASQPRTFTPAPEKPE